MAVMAFDTPKSSMTTRVWYDPDKSVLSMAFRAGGTHHFAGVPVHHYHGLQSAESLGKYYHAHIKGKFQPPA